MRTTAPGGDADGRTDVSVALRLHRDGARQRGHGLARAGPWHASRGPGAASSARKSPAAQGGTVAVLGLADCEKAFECLVEHYARRRREKPYVFRGSSPGADRFGVIEVAANASYASNVPPASGSTADRRK